MGQVPIIGAPGSGAGRTAGRAGPVRRRERTVRRGAWVRQPDGGSLWVPVLEPAPADAAPEDAAPAAAGESIRGSEPVTVGDVHVVSDGAAAGTIAGAGGAGRAGKARVDPAVGRLREAGLRCSVEEAEQVAATRGVVDQVRMQELKRRGMDASHACAGTRAMRQAVRMAAIGEVEVALGFGSWEAGLLVRAAMAPGELYRLVEEAMRRGETTWAMVRAFYERTASLEDEARLLVGTAMFGTDPGLAVADRLGPDDDLHGRPWSAPHYAAALEAQVVACRGADVEAERAARARAYRSRRMRVRMHDDGTASMTIRGPAALVVAAGERVERDARAVNAVGDPRTLDQLGSDLALGTLAYATIPVGDSKGTGSACSHVSSRADAGVDADTANADAKAPARTSGAAGAAAHDAQPSQEEVTPGEEVGDPDGTAKSEKSEKSEGAGRTGAGGRGCSCDCEDGQGQLFDELVAPADLELLARVVHELPPVALQVVVPYVSVAGGFPICASCSGTLETRGPRAQPPRETSVSDQPRAGSSAPDWIHEPAPDPGEDSVPGAGDHAREPDASASRDRRRGNRRARRAVGEVLGAHPFFISDGHARELALLPGTILHRLVVDPRDGRLVERTISGYRPDADMRRQVVAADIYSRAPGARMGSQAGELDHVTPYGWAGGPTSEQNLALLARRPHKYKTDGTWQARIGPRRDLTFTTLLGQVVTTRVHDYRTYLDQQPEDLEDRQDAANQLLLAALGDRDRRRGRRSGDWISLDHTDPTTGRRRPGLHPDQPTLDELLDRDGGGHGADRTAEDRSDR